MRKLQVLFLLICCSMLFVLPLQSSISIKNPIGVSKWFKGESYEILWDKTGTTANRVAILLLDRNASRIVLYISRNTLNDGSFRWKIPNTRRVTGGKRYVIRIIGDRITGESMPFLINKAKTVIRRPGNTNNLSTVNPNSVQTGTDKANVKPLPDLVVDHIYAEDGLELCIRVKSKWARFSGKIELKYSVNNRKVNMAKNCTINKNGTFIIRTGRILNGNDLEKDLKTVKTSCNIDWRNQIVESNENNNFREINVYPQLRRPDYIPAKVTSYKILKRRIINGKIHKIYKVSCFIKNIGDSYKGDIKIIWKVKRKDGAIQGAIWGPGSLEISPLRDERILLMEKRYFFIPAKYTLETDYNCEVEIIPVNGNLELNTANNKATFRFTRE
ncbi:MAG: hypothetical protein ABFR75_14910 [Acidobacteriota bacterium]